MTWDFDLSVPNNDTAVVQNIDPESLRPISDGTLISKSKDNKSEHIPKNGWEECQFDDKLKPEPGINYVGQLTFVSGKKLGRKARLHVSLAHNGKIVILHKTKTRKCDKSLVSTYEETFSFEAPPEAHLIFGATSYHLILRDEHLGIAQIPLEDRTVTRGNELCVNLGKGLVNFRLNYPITVVDESDSPEFPISDYHYRDDDFQYEEKMYNQQDVVV